MKQRNRLDWMLAIAVVERFRVTQRLLVSVGSIPTWVILPLCICGGSYNLFTHRKYNQIQIPNSRERRFETPFTGIWNLDVSVGHEILRWEIN